MADRTDRGKNIQFSLSTLFMFVFLCAIGFTLVRWRGRSALPAVCLPPAVISSILVVRNGGSKNGHGMALAAALAGAFALGLMAFATQLIPPLPTAILKWLASIGTAGPIIGLSFYGLFGFIDGLVLGHIAERCFRRTGIGVERDQITLALVFLVGLVTCLILFLD